MKRGRGAPATQDVISSYTTTTSSSSNEEEAKEKGKEKKKARKIYEVDVQSPLYPM
jgi:hypothetical protein